MADRVVGKMGNERADMYGARPREDPMLVAKRARARSVGASSAPRKTAAVQSVIARAIDQGGARRRISICAARSIAARNHEGAKQLGRVSGSARAQTR
jgi:hypothetical protein